MSEPHSTPASTSGRSAATSEIWDAQWVGPRPLSDPQLKAGDVIGKCRITREIGAGGMGTVYLARHTTLDVDVALKILPPVLARDNPALAKRFIREAQIAARIHHPNVVAVMDADFDAACGLYYILFEYVPGGSLADRLAKGRLSEEEALGVTLEIAQALVVAAEHGIVHRDIKPDNIMLDHAGHAKLADLGLARQELPADTRVTKDGTTVGTPAYMSPDQVRDAALADAQDDIYSLGATLYECLTGEPPYAKSTTVNIISDVLYSPTPDPRDKLPLLSPALAAVSMKMMAKEKADRYASAIELVWDLKQIQLAGGKSVKDLAAAEFLDPAARRRRRKRRPRDVGALSGSSRLHEWAFALAVVGITATLVALFLSNFSGSPQATVHVAEPTVPRPSLPPAPKPPDGEAVAPGPKASPADEIPPPPPGPSLDEVLAMQPEIVAERPAMVAPPPRSSGAETAPPAREADVPDDPAPTPVALGKPVPFLEVPAAEDAFVATPTGFAALRLAAAKLDSTAATSVMKIEGERMPASRQPQLWRFLFYDPKASRNVRAVTVRGHEVVSVEDGLVEINRLRLFAYKPSEVLPPEQLKIDSDEVLRQIEASPQMNGTRISSASFILGKGDERQPPVWHVSLYSERGDREVPIGEAWVSAETGTVVQSKLRLDRLKSE